MSGEIVRVKRQFRSPDPELSYPDETLRVWSRILHEWPDRFERPRLSIVPVGATYEGPQGTYDGRRHVVTLYPSGWRSDDLCTLVHELAHAWTDGERASHGPMFRETYIALFEWFVGEKLDVPQAVERHTELVSRGKLPRARRGNATQTAVLDMAFTGYLETNPPKIVRTTTADGRDFNIATLGTDRSWLREHHGQTRK